MQSSSGMGSGSTAQKEVWDMATEEKFLYPYELEDHLMDKVTYSVRAFPQEAVLRFRNTIAQRIQEGLDLPEWQLFVRDHLRELIQRLGPRNHELFPEGGD